MFHQSVGGLDADFEQLIAEHNRALREGEKPLVVSNDAIVRQSQEALREGERRFRALLEALPAAVYTTDTKGCITFYNKAAVEFAGRAPALGEKWCVT